MQAGGSLNAFATKFLSANFVVLFSDLLEACGDDHDAADFVIGHEIGHVKAGHLRFQWLLVLGRLFPFIGSAYSRAREFTADRYGRAAVIDPGAGVRGLTVLAAGGAHAGRVNLQQFVDQRKNINTIPMMLGTWMSTHPPLAVRIAELDAALGAEKVIYGKAAVGAAGVIALAFLVPLLGGGLLMKKFMNQLKGTDAAVTTASTSPERSPVAVPDPAAAAAVAQSDLQALRQIAADHRQATGSYPEDTSALYRLWKARNPDRADLVDPFDGGPYGYELEDGGVHLWSAGSERAAYASMLSIDIPAPTPAPAPPAPPAREPATTKR
jgi:hypothetical protein